ncbi:Eco57I restriction-modification methylase domain-containing protein [Nonlabens spongiae]|uniref:Eco57I restriction-modification methylase domain-containing protein n=1 Tax=Nonlabens spongiae TaxID=331648 RepID=UPI000A266FF8|nr:TaqI-like C-terminal specificity domain-containing protein [Nonlabens spongiae]
MALFQTSVLKSHLAQLDVDTVDKSYKKFQKYFHNTTIQENIRANKEEQFQAKFLDELFVNILGYTLSPKPDFNLTTEFKNVTDSKKADGAILNDGKAVAVIELKGTKTKDLESIRQQAFGYKNNQPDCVYVITSNFEKLRFYINDATEFEEFDLFSLSRKRFHLLYLCLYKDNVLNDVPLKIKEQSLAEEEAITKKFYKDYSLFKRELYRDLIKRNSKTVKAKLADLNESRSPGASAPRSLSEVEMLSDHGVEVGDPDSNRDEDLKRLEKNVKLTLFKKSQKLIDRFLFIFFAEDRLLLPSNSTLQILNKWKDDVDFGDERPLYGLFKQYFTFLDTGRKGTPRRAEIYAYNGGLFKPDAILDALEIDNDLLYKHTLQLSNYDFASQVDVNILGHIFENSLNEIESVNAEIEGDTFDKQTSKRKKDGVFYTPKYITKYIVENTVGKLCTEKKEELGFAEEEYFKGRKNRQEKTLKRLIQILDDYREWLLSLTICDPACGSGAFLNQALDFLIKEHEYIDELKTKLLGGGFTFPDIENTILENNIYGVDLNEESVEIAKLSLWLRTAQPRRKLNDLSSNIKCGNSLIDSKKVAGDKAFKWEEEFPQVFRAKPKSVYHITTALHDSRTSHRMKKYKVRENREAGTNPYPNVIYFTPEDDLVITEAIKDVIKEKNLDVLAYNICADHIHLLLYCELEEIPEIIQFIKGRSSYALGKRNNLKGLKPLEISTPLGNDKPAGSQKNKPLWSQKYSAPKEVTTQEQLDNTLKYIRNNRLKHELPEHSDELKQIINEMCTTLEEAQEKGGEPSRASARWGEPSVASAKGGGFDVVIGNPPYVRPRYQNEKETIWYLKNFKVAENQFDLYHLFIEKAQYLKNHKGIVSFILPNAFLANKNSQHLRDFLLTHANIWEISECGDKVFEDASVDVLIYVFGFEPRKSEFKRLKEKEFRLINNFDQNNFKNNDGLNFTVTLNSNQIIIFQKIKRNSIALSNVSNTMGGIKEYQIGKGTPPQVRKDKDSRKFNANYKLDETYVKQIRGKHVSPFLLKWDGNYISYGIWLAEPRNPDYFSGERIFIRQIPGVNRLYCCFSNEDFVVDQSAYIVKAKTSHSSNFRSLECLLNSRLMFWYYQNQNNEFDRLFPKIKSGEIKMLPIIESIFCDKARTLSESMHLLKRNHFDNIEKFKGYISKILSIKINRKLENWHELEFGEFIKELNKAIAKENRRCRKDGVEELPKLTKKDEFEWMELFEENKKKAVELQQQITTTEKEIDQMVYELYGLTQEEIEIVENS